jgi:hypothetical protein
MSAFTKACGTYRDLLGAIGLSIDVPALASHFSEDAEDRQRLSAVLDAVSRGKSSRGAVPDGAAGAAADLVESLKQRMLQGADGVLDGASPEMPCGDLAGALGDLDEVVRDAVADYVAQNGHRGYLRSRFITVDEFRQMLQAREDGGRMSLVKVVPFLHAKFAERGYDESEGTIRSWFDSAPGDAPVPYCARAILRGVNGEFKSALIPIQDMVGDADPDEWLEGVRAALRFRSHSAMHKALAAATGLKYDCVHKALSGKKKAKRVRSELKHCLDIWIGSVKATGDAAIPDEYRGVPVQDMEALLPELRQRFATKEQMYAAIAGHTGMRSGSVRRYFQDSGQLKCAPLNVYRCAQGMAEGTIPVPEPKVVRRASRRRATQCRPEHPRSYLADGRTRRLAKRLCERLQNCQGGAADTEQDIERYAAFMELRRSLIMTMKQGLHVVQQG